MAQIELTCLLTSRILFRITVNEKHFPYAFYFYCCFFVLAHPLEWPCMKKWWKPSIAVLSKDAIFSFSFFSYSKDTTANSLTHHQLAGQVLTLIWFFESNCEYSKTLVMSADPAALFTHVEWFKKLISYLYFCFPEESFPVQCTLIIPGVRSLNRNKSEDWFPAHQVNFCTTLW